jgi:hypothetical protein
MRLKQSNKLVMYDSIARYLRENSATVNTIPKFTQALTKFEAAIEAIRTKEDERQVSTKGKTEAKYNAEEDLINAILKIASGLFPYAINTNNTELRELADVNYSGLDRLKDVDLIAKGNQIHASAGTLITELADYGLTPDDLTLLKEAIDNYRDTTTYRDASVAQRKGASVSLKDLFNNADDILELEVDRFAAQLKISYPDFYNGYSGARIIKDIGIRHEEKTNPPAQP